MTRYSRNCGLCSLIILAPLFAFAWGPEGHEIVAQIAEERLNVNAKREVRKLLGSRSMADVANWADAIRPSRSETGPWHFVNIRVKDDGSHDHFDPKKDCEDGNCVVDKIKDFAAVVGDKTADRAERIEALKFLIHFTGDIHQPLHCAQRRYRNQENDRGGNEVLVKYPGLQRSVKLHKVWDSTVIDEELLGEDDADAYAHKLSEELNKPAMTGKINQWRSVDKPEEWAKESHALAVKCAYNSIAVDPPAGQTPKLDDQYVKDAKTVIEEQLEKAGVRLADLLNGMFP